MLFFCPFHPYAIIQSFVRFLLVVDFTKNSLNHKLYCLESQKKLALQRKVSSNTFHLEITVKMVQFVDHRNSCDLEGKGRTRPL